MTTAQSLPSVRAAKLPDLYQEARSALAECQKIDECKEWADKAAAMASYAKQAQDESLFLHATRIKARAIRRCGELLKQIEKGPGRPTRNHTAADTKTGTAARAGLSKRQKDNALRVASIPEDEFDAVVDSDDPPGTDELARMGTRSKLTAKEVQASQAVTRLWGSINRLTEASEAVTPVAYAKAVSERQDHQSLRQMKRAYVWLGKAIARMERNR